MDTAVDAPFSYHVWRAADGHVLGIARTSGPVMQSLTSDDVWVDNPSLIVGLRDRYDLVTEDEARAAAEASGGVAWPRSTAR